MGEFSDWMVESLELASESGVSGEPLC